MLLYGWCCVGGYGIVSRNMVSVLWLVVDSFLILFLLFWCVLFIWCIVLVRFLLIRCCVEVVGLLMWLFGVMELWVLVVLGLLYGFLGMLF